MSNLLKFKKALAFFAALALLASAYVAPAYGSTKPLYTQGSDTAIGSVQVTQVAPGTTSGRGLLEWTAVAGATEYRVYKTGTIRPTSRLVFVVAGAFTSKRIVDMIGATARYRVTALVNFREVLVGSFIYSPR